MYTASILGKSHSRENEQITVTVQFTEGASSFVKDFRFGADYTDEELKRRIKKVVNDLETAKTKVAAITEGAVDLTGVVQSGQTQAEKDEAQWFRQVNRLRAFQELKTLGGMPPAWQADVDALAAKVQTDAKKTYLNNL